MDACDVGRYWESNARAWTTLSQQGWDVYRDALNTPAFLTLLPDISGRSGLDIGCGEGHNTRLLAARGARMAGSPPAPSATVRMSDISGLFTSSSGMQGTRATSWWLPTPARRAVRVDPVYALRAE